jgi:hypothetical protein
VGSASPDWQQSARKLVDNLITGSGPTNDRGTLFVGYPELSGNGLVTESRLTFTEELARSRPGLRSGHPETIQISVLRSAEQQPPFSNEIECSTQTTIHCRRAIQNALDTTTWRYPTPHRFLLILLQLIDGKERPGTCLSIDRHRRFLVAHRPT